MLSSSQDWLGILTKYALIIAHSPSGSLPDQIPLFLPETDSDSPTPLYRLLPEMDIDASIPSNHVDVNVPNTGQVAIYLQLQETYLSLLTVI